MPKKFLTVKEVSRLLSVTPLTVRNWDKKGSLVAYRNPVNNYRMYKIEDVESLMMRFMSSKDIALETPQTESGVLGTRKLEIEEE